MSLNIILTVAPSDMGDSLAGTCLRIGIIEAGTYGLYLALLLQRAAHEVTLFAKTPEARLDCCGILLVPPGWQPHPLWRSRPC